MKQAGLRGVGGAAGAVCSASSLVIRFAVKADFLNQGESVGHKAKLVLRYWQTVGAFYSHGIKRNNQVRERGMVWVAQNYVVKHFDFKKLSGAYEVACHLNISFGWRGSPLGWLWVSTTAAAAVIMASRNTSRGCTKRASHNADADQIMAFDTAAGIQKENNEAFTLGVEIRMRGDMQPPIVGHSLRRIAQFQTLRRWTFRSGVTLYS